MKSITTLICFLIMAISLLADPSNLKAKRGTYTILSSEYGENVVDKKYPVSNAIDENPATAWVFEGKYSEFKGFKGLLISFDKELEIDGISIINGYAKNDSIYKQNNSVSEFEIIFSNKSKQQFKCNETLEYQDFHFPKQKVKWVIIKVLSERKGTKYNDLCISEISPSFQNSMLIYNRSNFIINNDGGEYQSDVILNTKSLKKFDTDIFDYVCGSQSAIQLNDSTLIYSDGCNDNSAITILHLQNFTYKTIKNKLLDNYDFVSAYSENRFILQEKDKNKFIEFINKYNSIKPLKYNIIGKEYFWKWNYRLNKDLSDFYPALLEKSRK